MSLFNVYNQYKINLVKGKGLFVYDDKNQSYLDLYGGHGVISIGHSETKYINDLTTQLNKIGYYSNVVNNHLQLNLAKELKEQTGYKKHQLFLCNSGAEANENALKLASFHTGKTKVIAFKNAFHGRTAAALNVTDNKSLYAPLNKSNFEVVFLELNDTDSLKKELKKEDVCAVILEGIQGVGGLDMATTEFFHFVSNQCKLHKTVFIVDEIQSGFGRSGKFFAHQYAKIKADIVTMAKGMGNGFPIAGLLISSEIEAKKGMLGTTFGGNYLACTAASSVLETIKSQALIENAKEVGKFLKQELEQLQGVIKVKGKGLMLGLELDKPIAETREKLLKEHFIFTGGSSNPNVLRILPPLTISKEDLAHFLVSLKSVLQ